MSKIQQPSIHLKPGREKSVQAMHPWIFSGAVQHFNGEPGTGETVEVYTSKGEWLCRGAYSPHSNIRVRVWTWDQNEQVDAAFFNRRILKSVQMRAELDLGEPGMLRLVNAESDGLPGLIVDRYNDVLIVQFLSAGSDAARAIIVDALAQIPDVACIYERSDVDVRELEGLTSRTGVLYGTLPEQPMICSENGLRFKVDLAVGHKTGFYLDQRTNRMLFQKKVRGKDVLNCFSYTGAFAVYALAGGANSVTNVDSSEDALRLVNENLELNGLSPTKNESIAGDVFQMLRTFRDQGKSFDVIVLDPPKFAPTSSQAQRAARGYKDINLLAFKLLRPGGFLFTFSCSGGIPMDLFQKIVASAALDAGVQAVILRRLSQDADHPVRLSFPESSYLKGLVCRLED